MLKTKDLLFEDVKPIKITEDVRKKNVKNPNLPVRQRLSMFYTDSEKEEYIKKSLKRKML